MKTALETEFPKNFDAEYYLSCYPDVEAAVLDGIFESASEHWLFGHREGRIFASPTISEMPERIGKYCIGEIGRMVNDMFYLVNQEQRAVNAEAGQQLVVPELITLDARFKLKKP